MLVLSRSKNESIVVDGGIRFTILEVRGNRVTVGVDAPNGTRIMRGEIVARAIAFDESRSEPVAA